MARVLVGAGMAPSVFDLSAAAMARAEVAGARPGASAAAVIAASEIILLSLPAAAHVTAVIDEAFATGALDGAAKVIVDASTSEAGVSRVLAARLAAKGHLFLDAPVSGGPGAAATGKLSMMIGGEAAGVTRARPVLEALAATIIHVGLVGAGNVAKLVNNMLVACHMITTREGLRLATEAGVSAEDALRVVNAATGRSAISEIHYPTWVLPGSYDSGFSTGLMRKDVRLALEMAGDADLPMARLAATLWAEDTSGLADQDDFMLIARQDMKETSNA